METIRRHKRCGIATNGDAVAVREYEMTEGYQYDPKAWGDDLEAPPHRDIDDLDLEHDTLGLEVFRGVR